MTRVCWAINVLIQFSLSTKEIARLKERHFVLKKNPRFFWTIGFFVSEKKIWCVETSVFTKKAPKKKRNISKNYVKCWAWFFSEREQSRRIYHLDLFLKLFAKFNGLKSVTIVNKPQNEIEVHSTTTSCPSSRSLSIIVPFLGDGRYGGHFYSAQWRDPNILRHGKLSLSLL